MPDNTPILQLPLILPAQAQKHVTHNEALRLLDVMVQLSVLTRSLTVPPATPSVGDRHIVPAGATGDWAGQAGRIALYAATGWEFIVPLTGWTAQVLTEAQAAVFDGVAWNLPSEGTTTVARLGVSTTADATNRLAVSSPATLLTHAGNGHQVKVDKATAGDTASLLFQTGFSGRAEMGTAGSDDFAIKVSADGATFYTALQAAAGTGEVTLPAPVHLGGQASDPVGPVNGTMWLNTTTGEVKLRSNGVTLVVGAGGGGLGDGDKGDVTVSASGATWTIDAGVVSLAKLADLASGTILGRATAGIGVPEALTAAQVRTLLNVADGATANSADAALLARANHTGTQTAATIAGLAAVATSGSAADLGAGTLPAARFDDTGHGSRAGGALHAAATPSVGGFMSGADKTKLDGVAAGAQVNVGTDLVYTAASRLLESSTGADATLPLVTSANAGLAPATGGGTANFLRADGTWAAPGGGGSGDVVGPVSATDNALARFDTTSGKLIQASGATIDDNGQVNLPLNATPVAPPTDVVGMFGRKMGGRMLPAIIGPSGLDTSLQPHLARNSVAFARPVGNGTVVTTLGYSLSNVGTATGANVATTNLHTYMKRVEYLVTTAAVTAVCGIRSGSNQYSIGGASAGLGGFHMVTRWGPATGVANPTHRSFCGMRTNIVPTDLEPSSFNNMVGMGWDAADTNIQFMHNDSAGTATKIDLGAAFPVPTADRAKVYEIAMFAPPGTAQSLSYEITDLTTGARATGTVSTDLPTNTTLLSHCLQMSVGGTSSVVGIALMSVYIETDY